MSFGEAHLKCGFKFRHGLRNDDICQEVCFGRIHLGVRAHIDKLYIDAYGLPWASQVLCFGFQLPAFHCLGFLSRCFRNRGSIVHSL